jgi:osmotically-inducible protein OsmY
MWDKFLLDHLLNDLAWKQARMKNDIQLQHDVRMQLERECHFSGDAIGVEVHHGTVKLAGSVRDYATMQRLESAALRVEGVATVVMDIDVIISTPPVRRSGRDSARVTAIA